MSKNNFRMYENLSFLTHIGFMMITPIFAGVYIGKLLDERFGTGNILLLVGILLGTGASFTNLYKFAMSKSNTKQRK